MRRLNGVEKVYNPKGIHKPRQRPVNRQRSSSDVKELMLLKYYLVIQGILDEGLEDEEVREEPMRYV